MRRDAGAVASGTHLARVNAYGSAICLVRRQVILAGRRLRPGGQFVVDVSAEEIAEGGQFKRELLTRPFHPTDEVDFCDPTSG